MKKWLNRLTGNHSHLLTAECNVGHQTDYTDEKKRVNYIHYRESGPPTLAILFLTALAVRDQGACYRRIVPKSQEKALT